MSLGLRESPSSCLVLYVIIKVVYLFFVSSEGYSVFVFCFDVQGIRVIANLSINVEAGCGIAANEQLVDLLIQILGEMIITVMITIVIVIKLSSCS